jgi:hypothetical protein
VGDKPTDKLQRKAFLFLYYSLLYSRYLLMIISTIWRGVSHTSRVLALLAMPLSAALAQTTLSYTGATQSYTVPAGVTRLQVTAAGASGANGSYASGGFGAQVQATLSVTPGEVLTVQVGGTGATAAANASVFGGYNGGGTGSYNSGSGGGATDVRRANGSTGDYLTSRNALLVAAGGGGGGWQNVNGASMGGTPTPGGNGAEGTGGWLAGAGATQTAPGAGGGSGQAGSNGTGGAANYAGGGGGGGYNGGGGAGYTGNASGYPAGGGGGSSWVSPGALLGTATYSLTTSLASGQVVLDATPILTAFSPNPGGLGQLVTLTGYNLSGVTTLLVNGVSATASIANNTSTSLSFRVPAGTPATGTTTVTTANGSTTSTTFTVMPAPGNALNFDGVNDYVALPTGTAMPTANGAYTIEAWIKPDIMKVGGIIGWGNYGATNQVNALRLDATNGGQLINYWWANDLIVTVGDLTGRWHHVAATFNGTTRTLYLDGVAVGSDTPTGHAVPNANNLRIGSTNNGEYFDGGIDEVRVWSVARTATQVQADMLAPATVPTTNLVAYFNMDQGTPGGTNTGLSTGYDLANNYPGTLTNFALTGNTSNWVESYTMVVPTTTAATALTATGFTANWTPPAVGTVDNGYIVDVSTVANFSTVVGGSPFTASTTNQAITGLTPSTTYYYRVRADKTSVTGQGDYSNVTMVTTPSNVATLSSLTLSSGALSPAFSAATTSYTLTVPAATTSTTVTPTVTQANATVTVNGTAVASGTASSNIALAPGATTTIPVVVTAQDGSTKTYTVAVTRPCTLQAVAQNVSVALNVSGQATVTAAQLNNNSTGTCTPVTYTVRRVVSVVVPEGGTATLTAPAGMTFSAVTFASYGTPISNGNGTYSINPNCHASISQSKAEAALLGKNSGTIVANNATFTDPCVNTVKTLVIQATYTAAAIQAPYTCADLGTSQVLLTATDANGNTSSAVATVSVSVPALTSTTWNGSVSTDWNDCRNWSYGQVPTATISAVIDGSVATSPIISSAVAVNNISITGASGLTLNSGTTLQVNGSWSSTSTGGSLAGTVAFVGTAAQTVSQPVARPFGTVLVNKASAGVQLSQSAAITTGLTLTSGLLTTGSSYQVALGTAATISESETSYVVGNVAITRNLVAGTAESFSGLGLTLAPAAGSVAPGSTQVIRTTGTYLTGIGTSQSVQRYFDIQPATNTGLNVTMIFGYFTHELNSIPEANLRLFKSTTTTSGPWTNMGVTSTSTKSVTRTGLADFSIWTLGNSANPLPVQLVDFTATAQGTAVALAWHTATEVNSDRFEVERSPDGTTFSKLDAIAAHGTTMAAQSYSYQDIQLPASVPTIYYRLRQVDLDGTAHYSSVRTVAVSNEGLAVFPNPAHANATLIGTAPSTLVQVFDALGRVVLATTTNAAGTALLALPTGLPAGVYVVRAGSQATRLTVE